MPNFRFVNESSTVQPTSRYAGRIPLETWSQYEPAIRRLHAQNLSRAEISHILRDHYDFRPSTGQLRDQMTRWSLRARRKASDVSQSDDIDDSTKTQSEGTPGIHLASLDPNIESTYTTIPDSNFGNLLSDSEMEELTYDVAVEIEILGDMLFSGRRYTAAFNVYSSLYNSAEKSQRLESTDTVFIQLRAILGCCRSAATPSEVLQASLIAERQLQRSFTREGWDGDDRSAVAQYLEDRCTSMNAFSTREQARFLLSSWWKSRFYPLFNPSSTFDAEWTATLRWYFERLDTLRFLLTYEHEMSVYENVSRDAQRAGSQSIIYWYLVATATGSDQNPPHLKVRLLFDQEYHFSIYETIALIASLLSYESILFPEVLSPERLETWLQTLIGGDLNDLQHVLASWERNSTPYSDTDAASATPEAVECPSHRMPDIKFLVALAAQARSAPVTKKSDDDWIIIRADHATTAAVTKPEDNEEWIDLRPTGRSGLDESVMFLCDSLVRMGMAYITARNEGLKSLNTRPRVEEKFLGSPPFSAGPDSMTRLSTSDGGPRLSSSSRMNSWRWFDPPLSSSLHGSRNSSYRSFQQGPERQRWRRKESSIAEMDVDVPHLSPETQPPISSSSSSKVYDPTISPPLRASDSKSYREFQSAHSRTLNRPSAGVGLVLPDINEFFEL